MCRSLRVLSEDEYKLFEQVYRADDLDEGKSVVVASDRRTIRGSGEKTAAGDYIAFVVKDDGEYDMDDRPLYIMDPTFVTVRSKQPTPVPTPGHDGNGGGCTVRAFGFPVSLLLLLLPMGLLHLRARIKTN
jgi:hypothetical protein